MPTNKTLLALTLGASLLGAQAAHAFPASNATRPVAASTSDTSSLQNVYYRGHYRGHHGYRYGRGAIGLGIAGAVIGSAIIANDGYRSRRYRSVSGRQQCADTYRSFDWDSGTYMGYDGHRHVCPYL